MLKLEAIKTSKVKMIRGSVPVLDKEIISIGSSSKHPNYCARTFDTPPILEEIVPIENMRKYKSAKRSKTKVIRDELPILEQIIDPVSLSGAKQKKNTKTFREKPPVLEETGSNPISDIKKPRQKQVSLEACPNGQQTVEQLLASFSNYRLSSHGQEETEHIQIKAEILSDRDLEIREYSTENFDECPNLESFVKNEPEELDLYDIQMIEEIDDGPPELELQIATNEINTSNACNDVQGIPSIDAELSLLKNCSLDMNKQLIVNMSNCDAEIKSKLKRKLKTGKAKIGKKYRCLYCDFQTKMQLGIHLHEARHLNNTITMHYCDKCSYKCSSYLEIKKHVKRSHPTVNSGSCARCRRRLITSVRCAKCKNRFHVGCITVKSLCNHVAESGSSKP
ncbi:uncharacterized protein LOC132704806 isoform X2 [Cylas formicarius]|nr:uncharacterized protein LOC132704806 isoform X2 [Cylas formicarius]